MDCIKFFNEIIVKYPVQTADEEFAMRRELDSDRDKLKELLVLHNIAFAMKCAKKYNDPSETLDDFIARAISGLVKAADSFDPKVEARFCTYAGYHIQLAMRDLFAKNLVSAKTHRMTTSCYDTPLEGRKGDGEDAATVGDNIVQCGKASVDWTPPKPEGETCREKDDFTTVIFALIAKKANDDPDVRAAYTYFIKGNTLQESVDEFGVTRDCIRQRLVKGVKKIRELIIFSAFADDFDLLYKRRHVNGECLDGDEDAPSAEDVSAFVHGEGIEIREKKGRSEDERVSLAMNIFDSACLAKRELMGRYGEGDPFPPIMRRIYELSVARGMPLPKVKSEVGMPVSYIMFMRSEAAQLVSDYKSGKLKPRTKCERVPRETKRSKSRIEQYEENLHKGDTYARFLRDIEMPRGGKKYYDRQVHYKPWRGGFYSEVSRNHAGASQIFLTMEDLARQVRMGNIPKDYANKKSNMDGNVFVDKDGRL